jgi:hypothetical protein
MIALLLLQEFIKTQQSLFAQVMNDRAKKANVETIYLGMTGW